MNLAEKFLKTSLLLISICLCLSANATSWKEVVEARVLKEEMLPLCEEDIYKVKRGTSPLMKKVINAVNKVKKKSIKLLIIKFDITFFRQMIN